MRWRRSLCSLSATARAASASSADALLGSDVGPVVRSVWGSQRHHSQPLPTAATQIRSCVGGCRTAASTMILASIAEIRSASPMIPYEPVEGPGPVTGTRSSTECRAMTVSRSPTNGESLWGCPSVVTLAWRRPTPIVGRSASPSRGRRSQIQGDDSCNQASVRPMTTAPRPPPTCQTMPRPRNDVDSGGSMRAMTEPPARRCAGVG